MADNIISHFGEFIGAPVKVARCRFTPQPSSTAQTLSASYGVASVTRDASVSGSWTVVLADSKVKDLEVFPSFIENDTTTFHQVRVEAITASSGTFSLTHKSVLFASMSSGPSASDTVDQVQFVCFYRVVD